MKILLATDGSNAARQGEHLVTSLFNRASSEVHAFSVKPIAVQAGSSSELPLELELIDQPPEDPKKIVEETVQRLSEKGFEASFGAVRGNPADEILRELDHGHYDLVVLGASHTTWMGNVLLGSVSTQVLHHAPCSAVVVHRAPGKSGKVLVGVDGSESSTAALNAAMDVLDPWRCTFTIATAVQLPFAAAEVYPGGAIFARESTSQGLEKRLLERAWHLVNRARWQLESRGFQADSTVLVGRAAPQLLKEVDNIGADLVVVGSRGLGPTRRTLLGSVSDHIVRHAPAAFVGRGAD
jgi:nucleotide-binding universal stress UspA family protein